MFTILHATRLLKIADMVEFDRKKFDYTSTCSCIMPRMEKLMGVKNLNGNTHHEYFGIEPEESKVLLNIYSPMSTANRKEVAKLIRTFVAGKCRVLGIPMNATLVTKVVEEPSLELAQLRTP